MDQARVHVDPFKDARDQIDEIVKALRPILPLKFETVKVAIKVPAAYAHKCYGTLKNQGIQKEEWAKDGSLIVVVELFAGMQGELYEHLNKLTNGTIETRIIS